MKNKRPANFCADRTDVMTNFAVLTNVVIERVHCTVKPVLRGHPREEQNVAA